MSIPGECVVSSRPMAVTISRLACDGCDLLADSRNSPLHGELLLWIGAIGPFDITVTPECDNVLRAEFRQPLDPRIIDHFGRA